jgi:YVTN family beta-propeller protein
MSLKITRAILFFALSALVLNALTVRAWAAPAATLLILDKRDNSLVIIDPASQQVVGRVPAGPDPHEVVASPDGRYAYVSNYGGPGSSLHTLSVIDLVAKKALPAVDLGALHSAHGLAFAGGKVYFTAETNKAIGRYDPATHQIDWVLGLGQNRTHMLVVSKDLKRIFTSNVNSDTISIVVKSNRPNGFPPGGPRPGGPPPGGFGGPGGPGGPPPGGPPPGGPGGPGGPPPGGFGGPGGPPPGSRGGPGGPPPGGFGGGSDWDVTSVHVGQGPEGFDLSPNEKEVWAANSHDGTISIVNVGSKKVTQTLDAHINFANRLKFTPDGRLVFVSSLGGGDLAIFDAATRKEVKRLKLGHGAAGILMVPDGSRAYVACSPDNTVIVLDLKTLKVIGHIDSGREPDGLAWAIQR